MTYPRKAIARDREYIYCCEEAEYSRSREYVFLEVTQMYAVTWYALCPGHASYVLATLPVIGGGSGLE